MRVLAKSSQPVASAELNCPALGDAAGAVGVVQADRWARRGRKRAPWSQPGKGATEGFSTLSVPRG